MKNFKFSKVLRDQLVAHAYGFAFVVFNGDESFCVQVFDEENEEAMESGETFEDLDGFMSLGEAMDFCADEAARLRKYYR